jgi:hypothetical protein
MLKVLTHNIMLTVAIVIQLFYRAGAILFSKKELRPLLFSFVRIGAHW